MKPILRDIPEEFETERLAIRPPRFEIGYWIRTDTRNARSWRVAERAGYTLDGILKNNVREVDDILSNTRIYSLTRKEFL